MRIAGLYGNIYHIAPFEYTAEKVYGGNEEEEMTTYLVLKILIAIAAAAILIAVSVEDIRTMEISDRHSAALLLLAALDMLIEVALSGVAAGSAGVIGSGAGGADMKAEVVAMAADRAAGAFLISGAMLMMDLIADAFGEGDVLLCFAAGALLGWKGMLFATVLAMMMAGLFAAAALATGRLQRRSVFPFGPFLAFGICCSLAHETYCFLAAGSY